MVVWAVFTLPRRWDIVHNDANEVRLLIKQDELSRKGLRCEHRTWIYLAFVFVCLILILLGIHVGHCNTEIIVKNLM